VLGACKQTERALKKEKIEGNELKPTTLLDFLTLE
jgi:hypothetical protein